MGATSNALDAIDRLCSRGYAPHKVLMPPAMFAECYRDLQRPLGHSKGLIDITGMNMICLYCITGYVDVYASREVEYMRIFDENNIAIDIDSLVEEHLLGIK
jgi:hypothetical protein